MIRATQSLLFAVIYSIYLVFVMVPVQGLVIRPLCALNPKLRPALLRWWFQVQAHWVMGLAQWPGGMRLEHPGDLPAEPLIAVMNHQSMLDIPAGVALLSGPYPVIPIRDKYTRGFPGISGLSRLANFPALRQGERVTRAEHTAMVGAAEAVERGERTLLLYPEGHRSPDGELQPFMTQGLKLVFRHAGSRPVYLIVIDGAWRLRGLSDIALRLSGRRVRLRVVGPFAIPAERGEHEAFIDSLRDVMTVTLAGMRGLDVPGAPETPGSRSTPIATHASLVG